jgi:hypothetical protein
MLGSAVLDVAIALVLVYLVLALVCLAIGELFDWLMHHRARMLRHAIARMLHDRAGDLLTRELYAHPLIAGLPRRGPLPAHIPPSCFAAAFLDLVKPTLYGVGSWTHANLPVASADSPDAALQRLLSAFISEAGDDPVRIREAVQTWFDSAMNELTRLYRHQMRGILLIIGAAVAFAVNADTLRIMIDLSDDRETRLATARLVEAAGGFASAQSTAAPSSEAPRNGAAPSPSADYGTVVPFSRRSGLPIGWRDSTEIQGSDLAQFLFRLLGVLITAITLSVAAPVLFDVLRYISPRRSDEAAVASRSREPAAFSTPFPPRTSSPPRTLPPA